MCESENLVEAIHAEYNCTDLHTRTFTDLEKVTFYTDVEVDMNNLGNNFTSILVVSAIHDNTSNNNWKCYNYKIFFFTISIIRVKIQ